MADSSSHKGISDAACAGQPLALTDLEAEIFGTLLKASQAANLKTTLRCAGGWVRDKLLGKSSDDIDIALDDMMGKEFAERVNEYLATAGQETHSVGVIQCNPEQSKHLETARMKVAGVWLDLVNLRSESYTEGSRIPEMQFGTPEQDALRRDFTVNSMFYNINEGAVEDLTGKGLRDLKDGIIRTPLEPLETFTDDPLRVLRAVRFAARFSFELDPPLVAAASSARVREELVSKVSRERVGTELDGMLNGPAPVAAARLLQQLRLFPAVFLPPDEQLRALGPDFGPPCLATMAAADALMRHPECQVHLGPEERRLCLLAALLVPLREVQVKPGKGKAAKQPGSLPAYLVREALKRRTKDGDAMVALHSEAAELLSIWKRLGGGGSQQHEAADVPASTRTALGQAIRRLKGQWELAAVIAPLLQMPEAAPLGVDSPPQQGSEGGGCGPLDPEAPDVASAGFLEVTNGLRAAVHACKLEKADTFKPLLDGKAVMAELGLKSGGPQLGAAMAKIMDWQLANPDGTAEQCREMLRSSMATSE